MGFNGGVKVCLWSWRRSLVVIGVVWLAMGGGVRAEEGTDVWAWLDVTVWKEGETRFHVFSHQAMSEGRGPIVQLVSPRFKYRARPWLELGAGLSMLRIEREADGSFDDQVRPELEVSPIVRLGEHWTMHLRNRAEMRWDEWEGEPRPRLRHRVQLTRKLDDWGPLAAFYFSDEWLVELDRGDWMENRLIPVGLTFAVTKQVAVDLFYMVRFFRGDEAWTNEQVAGVSLKLTL
jgi:hypothetical protein